jgi:hypothetical protein
VGEFKTRFHMKRLSRANTRQWASSFSSPSWPCFSTD